jgi:DNA-binding transcriptional regulator YdaS (Cro superfamily)
MEVARTVQEMPVIDRAIYLAGSASKLGRLLGYDRQRIHVWRKRGFIPSREALLVEEVTKGGVTALEVLQAAKGRE